jgi:hypothetical protein
VRLDQTPVSLRRFPYPYRAALAIANDADLLTPESFRHLYTFLGTDEETEWGPGLRLDLGGSFFTFRSPDSPNLFTVFDGLSKTLTADGEFILACARAGALDYLHTYGCFTDASHFSRDMAEFALGVFADHNVTVRTWVNHGPPSNVQGIGGRDDWQGDVPGTPGYHADLTLAHGVRWIWTGSEVTDEIALEGSAARSGLVARIRGQRRDERLVEPYQLRDGQHAYTFRRYSGLGDTTPVLDDLPSQLSRSNLDRLVERQGWAVVYQHLAVRRVREGYGTGAYGPVGEGWFQPSELEALRELARRHHSGEVWVAPTSILLRYHDVLPAVRWEALREPDGDLIVIDASELTGADELSELTFYCERPEQTRVRLGEEQLESVRVNPADETGRASITLAPRPAAPALP